MKQANRKLKRRYIRERIFILTAMICILGTMLFLAGLMGSIFWKGWRGFLHSEVQLEITLDPVVIGADGQGSALRYQRLIKTALRTMFPDAENRTDKKLLHGIASNGAGVKLREMVLGDHDYLNDTNKTVSVWLPAGSSAAAYFKGAEDVKSLRQQQIPESHIRRLQLLQQDNKTRVSFHHRFFTAADSRNPEMAGIGGALLGSFYTLLLAFLISFPTGTLASVYLEMFAPSGRKHRWWLDLLEININNLAAVPSIIFGLLGLAIFINVFHLPRSTPLVGGLVLALMTLPTIIIVARSALRSVPPSLLAASLSLGSTRMQGVFHHVLPAAMPGILTGTIIGMAQALGETAPLLMIGMVAFIANTPEGISDAATALPVQIFLWADSPERGFAELTSTTIIVLLGFLLLINASAIFLRQRLEIKW